MSIGEGVSPRFIRSHDNTSTDFILFSLSRVWNASVFDSQLDEKCVSNEENYYLLVDARLEHIFREKKK